MNATNLAPPFTRENARAMQLRATQSRVARIEREKAERLHDMAVKVALELNEARAPDDDEARKRRVQKQIDLILGDMERAKSVKVRLACSAALERLWKLVTPTAGAFRPSKRSDRPAMPALVLRKPA
jgi:hypothetical protein